MTGNRDCIGSVMEGWCLCLAAAIFAVDSFPADTQGACVQLFRCARSTLLLGCPRPPAWVLLLPTTSA